MSTIYVPRLIESVEQAEALPEGTPVLIKADGEVLGLEFARDLLPEHMTPVQHARHYALVPIEAKEVNVVAQGILEYDMNGRVVLEQANQPSARDYKRTEFHTAWRPA